MRLPPYTISGLPGTGSYFNGHTDEAMEAYGQQVRAQALAEAYDVCQSNLAKHHYPSFGHVATLLCMSEIRKLK